MADPTDNRRQIGMLGATAIGVGAIVGGGILALAGVAFQSAGPAAIVAFALNGLIAVLTAMSFAEMATAWPENGGAYAFTRKVLSVRAAFAVGWILWFASLAAGVLYALGFSAYALGTVKAIWQASGGISPAWLDGRLVSIAVALLPVAGYGFLLTRAGGGQGNWETLGKIVVFGIVIVAGLIVFLWRGPATTLPRLTPFFVGGLPGLAAAMGFTFIALQGFDIIAAVAGEVKDPERTLPRSMFASLGVALLVYLPLLFVVSTVGVDPGGTVVSMSETHGEQVIAVAADRFMGPTGFWLVMIAALLSMLSALYANMLAANRIAFAMGGDRTLPRWLGRRDARGAPRAAVWVTVGLLAVLILAVPNLAAAGAAASLIFLLSFTLAHIAAILARLRVGSRPGAFRTPLFPLFPGLGLVCCVGLAIFQSVTVPSAGTITLVWLAAGFVLYFTMLSGRAEVTDARLQATDPELARLRGLNPLVLVPMANPQRTRAMVQVANALAPQEVGRVLLLSVVAQARPQDDPEGVARRVQSVQDVLREALSTSLEAGIAPETLVTIAPRPWAEIERVAALHRCESLLVGLSDLAEATANLPLEDVIDRVSCDVVVMGAPAGWDLGQARRILVPVAGAGGHDELRARLLGSLCRSGCRQITYLRAIPIVADDRQRERVEQQLRETADDEAPGSATTLVVPTDDVIETVTSHAADADLVILGTRREGRHKAIGLTALTIARAAPATILISHATRTMR